MIKVNERKENIFACILFGIYFGVGMLMRYAVIPYCNPSLANFHVRMVYEIVPFIIIIGVGVGLVSFFFPKKMKTSRVGQGIVTGFSTGFGISTVIVLLFIPCV